MKTVTILLSASLLAIALPFALAADEVECASDREFLDYIEHPLSEGRYLYLNPTSDAKVGEWRESNLAPGLQTEVCTGPDGIEEYASDDQMSAILA